MGSISITSDVALHLSLRANARAPRGRSLSAARLAALRIRGRLRGGSDVNTRSAMQVKKMQEAFRQEAEEAPLRIT